MESRSWCLVQRTEIFLIQLATRRFDKITKKIDFCLYFSFTSLFFSSKIVKMIIKKRKNDNYIGK